jgi:hypothetical protein
MAQWYYAHNQQQKGPISWDNLRELASSARLARNDMVWCDGMGDWKRADAVEGLFRAGGAAASTEAAVTAEPARRKQAVDSADDDPGPDPAHRRRKKRRRKEGMSPGALAGIIAGGVVAGLMVIVIIIVLLVRTGQRTHLPPPPPMPAGAAAPVAPGAQPAQGAAAAVQPHTYVVSLREDQHNSRAFNLQQGQNVNITVNTHAGILQAPDVDLYITRAGDPDFSIFDDSLSKDCFVNFVAPATDQYFLRVENLGPGRATSTVSVR